MTFMLLPFSDVQVGACSDVPNFTIHLRMTLRPRNNSRSMRTSLRCLVLLFAFAAAALCFAQSSVWRYGVTDGIFGKVIRGSDGTIYWAIRDGTATSTKMRVMAVQPDGVILWDKQVDSNSVQNPFSLSDIEIRGTRLYLAYSERTNGGYGDPYQGHIAVLNATNGTQIYKAGGSFSITALAPTSTSCVVIGSTINQPNSFAMQFLDPTGNVTKSYPLTNVETLNDVVVDDTDQAYAVGSGNSGLLMVVSANASTFGYQKFYGLSSHNTFQLNFARLHPTNGKLYGLGSGFYNAGQNDQDWIALEVDKATGLSAIVKYYGSTAFDKPGGLNIDTNGMIVAAGKSDAGGGTTNVRRYNAGLTVAWTTSFSAEDGADRPVGFDSAHSIFVGDCYNPGSLSAPRVLKLDPANGTVDMTLRDNYGTNGHVEGLAVDPFGSVYIAGNVSAFAYVACLKQALLTCTNATPNGGFNVTATLTLCEAAPAAGSVWALHSSNTAAATVPVSVTIPSGGLNKGFTVTTHPVAVDTDITITATRKGFTATLPMTILAPKLSNLTASPTTVVGGVNSAGTVTLTSKAPTGGKSVALSSNLSSAASVPGPANVPAGSTSVGFTITTYPVSADKVATITATTAGVVKTVLITVRTPALSGFSVSPATVKGGLPSTLTVTINGKALTGGIKIQTYSGAPNLVTVPASVWVNAGATSKQQALATHVVTTSMPVLVFGGRNGVYMTTTLTLTP